MITTPFVLVIGTSFIAETLNQLLEQHAYRSIIVADLAAADRAVRAVIPDLVVVEYTSTVQKLVNALHSNIALPYIPLIVLYDDDQQLTLPDIAHVDGFLRSRATTVEQLAQVQLGVNLSRTRRELIRQSEHLRLVYDTSRTLHRSLDVDRLLKYTLEQIGSVLQATQSSILLLDEHGAVWRRILIRDHLSPAEADAAVYQVLRHGLAAHAIRSRRIQIVENARIDPRWLKFDDHDNVGSALALPLHDQHSDTTLGVLILVHHAPHHFTEEILPLAQALTEQLEVALTNASVYTRLREAEESREAFIHMLTHDLRAPLAGMISCFDALQTVELDAHGTLFVELGLQAGEEQQRLIDDLLDIYKAETGQMRMQWTQTSLADLGAALKRQLGARIDDAGLTLVLELPQHPVVWLDQHKMVRVLMNLVNNSIKWTERGGMIEVKGELDDTQLVLCVRDTGVGIAPEDLPHIFNRFYQGRVRGAGWGTGLGLTFAQLAVAAHAGSITVESSPGSGTLIRLIIPRDTPVGATTV